MTENTGEQIADAAAEKAEAPPQPVSRAMVMKQMCERIRLDESKSDSKRLAHLIEVLTCESANQTEILEQLLRVNFQLLQTIQAIQAVPPPETRAPGGLLVPDYIVNEGRG